MNIPGAPDSNLKLSLNSETPYWSQSQIPVPPGATALFGFAAAPDGGPEATSVWGGFWSRNTFGTLSEQTSPSSPVTLPASSTAWVQIPLQAFQINASGGTPLIAGDSQFPRFGLEEFRAHASGSSTQNVWFDDFALYVLSVNYTLDGVGNKSAVVGPDGGVVRYLRDRHGRLSGVVDPRGRSTTMAYDPLDRLIQATNPLGNSVSYSYDPVGNLSSFTDPNGNVTTYAYDSDNRLTTITYPDSTTCNCLTLTIQNKPSITGHGYFRPSP